MDHGPKKKVKDIIDENSTKDKIIINDFARFKMSEVFTNMQFYEKDYNLKMEKTFISTKEDVILKNWKG